jgi:ADP-ribosyl-[dinitrogen reductase] hydrolase
MEGHHWPIVDVSVPCESFEASWSEGSQGIQALLDAGSNVLIHCKGGLGRAGMIAARLLVQLGTDPAEAIASVRAVRPGAIQTPNQEAWVRAGRVAAPIQPSLLGYAVRDRARGALLGLAVGDAVGTTIEFTPKPDYALINDMVGGGPFQLKPGEWTDDTAMALALADSLLAHPRFDASDLMTRFVSWRDEGTYTAARSR